MSKELKHNYMIRLEPANTKLGGIPGQASIFSHEAGHLLAGHIRPRFKEVEGQAAVDHEIEANTLGDAFAKHVGLEVDNTHQTSNLNTYRRANGLPLADLTPEEEQYRQNRREVASQARQKHWADTFAIGKSKFTASEPKAFINDLVWRFISARKNRGK